MLRRWKWMLVLALSPAFAATVEMETLRDRLILDNEIAILEDPTRSLDFDAVQKKKFRPLETGNPNFGFSDSIFWARFEIRNTGRRNINWLLEIGYPLLNHLEFYHPEKKGWQRKIGGDTFPFSSRELPYRNTLFSGFTPPGVSIYFLKIDTDTSVNFPLILWNRNAFHAYNMDEYLSLGLYFGSLMVMLLYNLFLYLTVRDRAYLYYVLYIFTYGITTAALGGMAFQFLWPDSVLWANACIGPLVMASMAMIVQFSRKYLDLRNRQPLLHRILLAVFLVLSALSLTAFLLPYRQAVRLASFSALITAVLAFSTGISSYLTGYRPSRYFLIAWTMLLVGIGVYALRVQGLLPENFFTKWSLQIGSILEMVLLSIGLGYRYRIAEEEKEKAEKEALSLKANMYQELETKVTERTAEVQEALDRLQITRLNLLARNEEIESIVDVATAIQSLENLDSITEHLARYLNNYYKFQTLQIFVLEDENRLKQIVRYDFAEKYTLPGDLLRKMLKLTTGKKQSLLFLRDQADEKEFLLYYLNKKYEDEPALRFTVMDQEDRQEIEFHNLIVPNPTQVEPNLIAIIPMLVDSRVRGMVVMMRAGEPFPISSIQSLAMLDRLGRLLAVPIYQSRAIESEVGQRQQLEKNMSQLENEMKATLSKLENARMEYGQTIIDLKEAEKQLVQAEKMSTLGQMIAGVAHEINNPVNYIGAAVSNLSRNLDELFTFLGEITAGDPEAASIAAKFEADHGRMNADLNDIRSGIQKVGEINKALRNYSRLETDAQPDCDLSAVMRETLVMLNHRLKSVTVKFEPPAMLQRVTCFPSKIGQVFTNIIANAVDAMEDARVKTPVISISMASAGSGGVKVLIADNGPGVPENLRQSIMQPFFTTKPRDRGTGLGLAVCSKIIREHGGTIDVGDAPGGGAVFSIHLPSTPIPLEKSA